MTAQVYRPSRITAEVERTFDTVYIPLIHWDLSPSGKAHGVILPPVIFDRETDGVRTRLADVLRRGARDVLIGNVGHLPLVREVLGSLANELDTTVIRLHGGLRLNVTNAESADVLLSMGLDDLILSPELTLPRLRDISDAHAGRASAVVYGRIPMMLLEKCAIRALYDTPADKSAPCGKAGASCAICAKDAATPYDYELTNRLIALAEKKSINHAVDIFYRYGTDANAALKAGNNLRAAAFGMAVYCSHGMERTHIKGLENTANLLLAYVLDI